MKKIFAIFTVVVILAGLSVSCLPPSVPADEGSRAAAPIQVTVTTDKPFYLQGQPVLMTLTMKNVSSSLVTVKFPTAQRFDFVITYQSDPSKEVYRWSRGKVFAQVLGSIPLAPGQAVSWRVVTTPITGLFTLTGIVASTPSYSAQTKFQVAGGIYP